MEKYKDEEYRGYTINVYYDPDPESPREWSNVANVICFGDYRHIGDKHTYSDFADLVEELCREYLPDVWETTDFYDCCLGDIVKQLEPFVIIRPVSCYEHSGMTIWVGNPNDRWDSSCIGVVYQTKDDTIHLQDGREEAWEENAERNMGLEIKLLDQYIRGDVYCYSVEDEDGDEIESCGGYFGDEGPEECICEAHAIINSHIKDLVMGSPREPMLFSYEEMTGVCV